jgi:hypothetical protein
MNPTVTGALIAGCAALIGFAASGWQNARSIGASRRTARDQRLWEKKTSLYEEIGPVLERVVDYDLDPITGFRMLAKMEPLLGIYASKQVRDRFGAARTALSEVRKPKPLIRSSRLKPGGNFDGRCNTGYLGFWKKCARICRMSTRTPRLSSS